MSRSMAEPGNLLEIEGSAAIALVVLSPAEFLMGSTRGLPLELPVHRVQIDYSFLLGKFPVTQEQWYAVMGSNPACFRSEGNLPVDNVSFEDALSFCGRLTSLSGRTVRLPSEAEWEFACRAGTTSEFSFGNEVRALSEYAWFDLNSQGCTHPVGMKRSNPWGLFDMLGNVWEWCADVWHSDYQNAPDSGCSWLADGEVQPRRCLRGGSWNYDAFRCRSAYRSREWKDFAADHFGLRIVVAC
jgi:formylglycine-generating enzyme required for sulfatase activity